MKVRLSRRAISAFALGGALIVGGCAGEPRVTRVYEGRIVEGPFVPPEAYAAYLKGVLAEEAGDLRSALSAYETAAREDDEDPEPLTRVGDVRCRLDPKGRGADDAFTAALKIDPSYAPAIAAKARCAGLRGNAAEGAQLVDRVATEDRSSVSLEATFVRLAAQRSDPNASATGAARERAIALTLASGEYPVAWEALIAWGRAKSDDELLARGLEGLVKVAPTRSSEIEAGALELLGVGRAALARRVAATLADLGPERGVRGIQDPTVARLAVDDAILSADTLKIERRAVRGRVPMAEVAARALLLEKRDTALTIAKGVVAADPTSSCASMVLASLAQSIPGGKDAPSDRPAAACALVMAERIAASSNAEIARTWLARVNVMPLPAHDPVVGPLAVDLAARGVLGPNALPLELRVELAARRREAPPSVDTAAIDQHVVDQKHALLWHVLIDPTGAPAKNLIGRMYNASDRDPIVGFSVVRAALASASANKPDLARAIAAAPAHPLLLAVAVELAKKGGRAEDVPPARARLMAVARTPAERALAGE